MASKQGFGSMDEQKQREIASKGGKAAHAQGKAHEFSSEEAREQGAKGGRAAHESGNALECSSEEARKAGRKGGQQSQGRNQQYQAVCLVTEPSVYDEGLGCL